MLVIREAQMEGFREAARRRFPEELVQHIGKTYPDVPLE